MFVIKSCIGYPIVNFIPNHKCVELHVRLIVRSLTSCRYYSVIKFRGGGANTLILINRTTRLDFQGFTSQGDYNYQVQIGRHTAACVILSSKIIDMLYDPRYSSDAHTLYVARQLAGSLLNSFLLGKIIHLSLYSVNF